MDYEFKKDSLSGQYYCHCSMGHEIFGRWLQEEIGADKQRIRQVLQLIETARNEYSQEHQLSGREISLVICSGEVTVQENIVFYAPDQDQTEEEFDLYESESSGCCGIEDFEKLLSQWAEFTGHSFAQGW